MGEAGRMVEDPGGDAVTPAHPRDLEGTSAAQRPRPARVLVVDDQRLFADGLVALLAGDERIDVVGQAHNGRDAVELAAELCPDVVLMDLYMPLMDGVEATRLIRRASPTPCVLMLSGGDARADLRRATSAGAAGYLSKDIMSSDLVGAVLGIVSVASASQAPLDLDK